MGIVSGIGNAVAAGVTSLGCSPTVGTLRVGAPNIAPTNTRDGIGFRSASCAGAKRQARTAATTAVVNGGVERSTSIAPTAPRSDTLSDSRTWPALTACTGTIGNPPF
jgi:hypothetical protein